MCLTRVRWLTAVCLSLGIARFCPAEDVWRPVARSVPPVVIATSGPARAAPRVVTVGKPIAMASGPAPLIAIVPPSGVVVRGQSPDLDSGSPYPPPVPTAPVAPPHAAGPDGPYSTAGGRFTPPALDGVTLPLVDMPPAPTSGDPVQATSPLPPPPPPPPGPTPTVSIGRPRNQETQPVSATVPAVGPVDPPPPSAGDPGNAPPQPTGADSPATTTSNQPDSVPPPGTVPPPADLTPGVATDRPVGPGFWEKCGNLFHFGDRGTSCGRAAFQSDHAFDAISSPVTMPFYAEDPRSLTEVRPIFIYQKIPGNAANFGGGNVTFLGTQARLALTERLSIVMSEFGYLWLDPKDPVAPAQKGSDFSDMKIGGKYTFLRNSDSGTVAAFGVNFEFPLGGATNLQNTGSLSIDPYLSFGQTFGRLPGGFGSLNFLNTTGYSASVDRARAEFVYSTFHLDYNVANANKFFPLVELNYIHYTSSGTRGDLGTEGADLMNLGSTTRRGSNYLSTAAGLRYRFTEHIQVGGAVEVPLTQERGLSDYRLTFDVIFRY